jgi:hypothetical protein
MPSDSPGVRAALQPLYLPLALLLEDVCVTIRRGWGPRGMVAEMLWLAGELISRILVLAAWSAWRSSTLAPHLDAAL